MALDWVDGRKLSSKKLGALGLKQKEKLHEESAYILLTERTVVDLLLGIRELFKEETSALLYHAFKAAGKRKAESLLEDMRKHQEAKKREFGLTGDAIFSRIFAKSAVLKEALEQLETEGYAQEFTFDVSHTNRTVKLVVKSPLSLRLRKLAKQLGGELTGEEAAAIGRGLVAGVISAVIGENIDVKEVKVTHDTEVYTLPKRVYEVLFA